jgi:hypothetical protein
MSHINNIPDEDLRMLGIPKKKYEILSDDEKISLHLKLVVLKIRRTRNYANEIQEGINNISDALKEAVINIKKTSNGKD